MDKNAQNYDAFISYKHDRYVSIIAHAVLRKLEHYRPPKGSGAQKKKIYLCIDDQNFATAGILNKQMYEALAKSEYLIYLACPETLGSDYCLDEIRYFKKLHDGKLDNIIVLLIKGEPQDVFPKELCYEGCWEPEETPDPNRKTEIHWLDLRAGNIIKSIKKLNQSLLMLAAPLLHCELDELIQREKQWKKQKRLMWGMAGVVMLSITLCVAYTFWLTWSVDYKRQAENALADGDDNKALFYYAKVLSMNPVDEEARINAQILLQEKAWPMVVKEEKDADVLGNSVYPILDTDTTDEMSDYLVPACITTEGRCILWAEGTKHYYFSDADGNNFEELPDAGVYIYPGSQKTMDAWCFFSNEEPHYTFYWPEDNLREKLEWSENFIGEWYDVGICALQPGIIAIINYEALTFYQIEDGVCRELQRIEFNKIFNDDQSIQERYNVSLMENAAFEMWASPDGSRLVMTANFWYNSGPESICYSQAALFDTNTYHMITLVESRECLIYDVIFQDDSQKLALIYNNQNGILENRGYAAVYDCFGNLEFQTECSSDVVPWKGYFCGKAFLMCDLLTTYFLDVETGEQLCEPLMLHVNQAALTDDGQIALECPGGVRYCRLVQYSGGIVPENIDEAISDAFRNEMEMRYQIADNLWLFTSDDGKEICLADENDIILDRFLIQEKETENIIIALAYGKSAQTAFVLDAGRDLYCVPVDLELKKFASKEEVTVRGSVLGFAPAKDGVVYLDRYFPGYYYSNISNLMYITNDNFLFFHDPAINYLGWISEPNIKGAFAGLISGESDYAVIVTGKEEDMNLRFFSMKTGEYLVDISVKKADDLFVFINEEDTIFSHSDGKWHSMWLGLHRADSDVTQQLMNLSGYMLSGSHFRGNLTLEYAKAVMSPDSTGDWSEYLEWTFLPLD